MQDNTQEKTHESRIGQEPVEETGYGAVHRRSQQRYDGWSGENDSGTVAGSQSSMDAARRPLGKSGNQDDSLDQPFGMATNGRGLHQSHRGDDAFEAKKNEKITIPDHLVPILYLFLFTASKAVKKILIEGITRNGASEDEAEKPINAFVSKWIHWVVGIYIGVSSIMIFSRKIIGEQASFGLYLSVGGAAILALGITVATRHYGLDRKGTDDE